MSSQELVRDGAHFAGSLSIVSGHVYLYAWYLGMWHALQAGNMVAVASLWQAGLTVTIHLRAGLTATELAVLSIQQSEQRKGQDFASRHATISMPAPTRPDPLPLQICRPIKQGSPSGGPPAEALSVAPDDSGVSRARGTGGPVGCNHRGCVMVVAESSRLVQR